MSIDISHGYRITTAAGGRPDPFAVLEDVRTAISGAYRDQYARTLAELACLSIDKADRVPGAERPTRPVFTIARELDDARRDIQRTGHRNPLLDFSFELTLLTDPGDPTGPLYALVYTEQEAYWQAFGALLGVTPWPYWSSSEGPAELSAQEWADRGELWERTLGSATPATRGLSWRLFGRYDPTPSPEDIEADVATALPDREARAEAVARELVQVGRFVDGHLEMRDADDIRADRAAMAAELVDGLAELTVDDLYGRGAAAAG